MFLVISYARCAILKYLLYNSSTSSVCPSFRRALAKFTMATVWLGCRDRQCLYWTTASFHSSVKTKQNCKITVESNEKHLHVPEPL